MTDPRRRIPAGRRDAERLLDGHGRHAARPFADGHGAAGQGRHAAHGHEDQLSALLADAAAPPRGVDPSREREALRHFRTARGAATQPPTVRQRVAALSATAKVLSIAVGATATGGVALASASVPLNDGLRPSTSRTSGAPAGAPANETQWPTSQGSVAAVTTGSATATEAAQALPGRDPRTRNGIHGGRGSGRPDPTGTAFRGGPSASPTTTPTTPTGGPTDSPVIDPSDPAAPPTTTPPTTRDPDFRGPPDDGVPTEDPTPTEDAGGDHDTPTPTGTQSPAR
jgi:hypothetical protein